MRAWKGGGLGEKRYIYTKWREDKIEQQEGGGKKGNFSYFRMYTYRYNVFQPTFLIISNIEHRNPYHTKISIFSISSLLFPQAQGNPYIGIQDP